MPARPDPHVRKRTEALMVRWGLPDPRNFDQTLEPSTGRRRMRAAVQIFQREGPPAAVGGRVAVLVAHRRRELDQALQRVHGVDRGGAERRGRPAHRMPKRVLRLRLGRRGRARRVDHGRERGARATKMPQRGVGAAGQSRGGTANTT